jgi:hypothetical protein
VRKPGVVPLCPRHGRQTITIRRDGLTGKAWKPGYTRHQRWRCFPLSPRENVHVFVEPMPRRVLQFERECDDCERVVPPDEGPRCASREQYTIKEAATALVAIGTGVPYRTAGAALRRGLGRPARVPKGNHPTSRDANLVMGFVELLTDVVAAPFQETSWPEVLLIDTLPFRVRPVHAIRDDWTSPRIPQDQRVSQAAFYVHAVMGYFDEGKSRLMKLVAVPDKSSIHIEKILRSLPGIPQRVVCDGAPEIANAVLNVFTYPNAPLVWLSHFHAKQQIKDKFTQRDPLLDQVDGAFRDVATWQAWVTAVRAYDPVWWKRLHRWLDDHEAQITWQLQSGLEPASTGALEQSLNAVAARLNTRTSYLRNRERTNRMLELMRLSISEQDSVPAYAKSIRHFLEAHDGTAVTPAGRRAIRCITPIATQRTYTL